MNEDRMDFSEFKEMVSQNIRDYLPPKYKDAEISVEEVHKLGQTYTGMTVRMPGQNIVPYINLDASFRDFNRRGTGLQRMNGALESIAQQAQSQLSFDAGWLNDYRFVKHRLYVRASNAQEDNFLLANLPHRETDGIAVSCHIAFKGAHGIEASTPVTYDLMERYGVSEEQLFQDAFKSSQELLPASFVSLGSLLGIADMDSGEPAAQTQGEPQLMVLTNDQALHGAGALFYPGKMDELAQQLGSDYFVIPSSVHEVLILKDDGNMDYAALESMVQDVNMQVVSPEDVLSDTVYHYDAADHVLEKAQTYALRMEQKAFEAQKSQDAEKTTDTPHKDREEGKGDSPRTGKTAARKKESEKKERKSVLERLGEKKGQLKSQPQKSAPAKARESVL